MLGRKLLGTWECELSSDKSWKRTVDWNCPKLGTLRGLRRLRFLVKGKDLAWSGPSPETRELLLESGSTGVEPSGRRMPGVWDPAEREALWARIVAAVQPETKGLIPRD